MELKNIFKGVELFEGLNDQELDKIIGLCQERNYKENDIVAKQNTPGNELFIIQEGFVEINVERGDNTPSKVIVNLGSGQTIGEMTLVDQGPRSATVRAIQSPTTVQVIDQVDFADLCEREFRIGYIVMRNIAADLSFRLRQRHLSDKRG